MKSPKTKRFSFSELPEKGVCNIYLLYQGDEVIYVGQTRDMRNRIRSHLVKEKKEFSHVEYFEVDHLEANLNEARLIVKHKPKLNRTLPFSSAYITSGAFKTKVANKISDFVARHNAIYTSGRGQLPIKYLDAFFAERVLGQIETLLSDLDDKYQASFSDAEKM